MESIKISLLLALIAVGTSNTAFAQYRYVAPDGTPSFSDIAPVGPVRELKVQPAREARIEIAATLPYDLGLAASRYPVTLYTSADCETCDQARNYLKQRGVPFAEKTVQYDTDVVALKKIIGSNTVPAMTVGSQKLLGFSEANWSGILDDAGYPKTSKLPRDYVYATPSPLTTEPKPATDAPAAASPSNAAPAGPAPFPQVPPPSGNAPPGFHF